MDIGSLKGSRGELIHGFTIVGTGAASKLDCFSSKQCASCTIIPGTQRGIFNVDGEVAPPVVLCVSVPFFFLRTNTPVPPRVYTIQ